MKAASRILIIDDEPGMLEVCSDTLGSLAAAQIVTESDARRGMERVRESEWDLLILDIQMNGLDGVELLRRAQEVHPGVAAIMITAYPTIETAVESMKLGACDYVTKPFLPDDLLAKVSRVLALQRLEQENRLLANLAEGNGRFDALVGRSAPMKTVYDLIQRIAGAEVDVLITGESGTGKELVARSLHQRSGRSGRFVPIDCGAIPESLVESELFGHEKGAFTGAEARSIGLVEFADEGTVFLDEVGELPLTVQARLLRVLQERSFRRVGGRQELDVDLRVVAATNRDLEAEVKRAHFREDLYYRLNVVPIHLPPLRRRPEDVPLLFEHFLARFGARRDPPVTRFEPRLVRALQNYDWPGNVRELQSTVRRMVTMTQSDELTLEDLPDQIALAPSPVHDPLVHSSSSGVDDSFFRLRNARVNAFEREYLTESLTRAAGDVAAAAMEAGMPRGTYYRLLKKHGISPSDFRRPES